MAGTVDARAVTIRDAFGPGDLGYVIHMHGRLYGAEYGFGVQFEMYVAAGIGEFFDRYEPARDCVWLCEHQGRIVGSLFLVHRDEGAAQLRYFLLEPACRGIGVGKRLMDLFMQALVERGYTSSFLWTTHELATAAALYRRYGFVLTEEKESTTFGKRLREHRYDLRRVGS